jgi:hypothetical protein
MYKDNHDPDIQVGGERGHEQQHAAMPGHVGCTACACHCMRLYYGY